MTILKPHIKDIKKPHPHTPFPLYIMVCIKQNIGQLYCFDALIIIVACALLYPIKFIIFFPQPGVL